MRIEGLGVSCGLRACLARAEGFKGVRTKRIPRDSCRGTLVVRLGMCLALCTCSIQHRLQRRLHFMMSAAGHEREVSLRLWGAATFRHQLSQHRRCQLPPFGVLGALEALRSIAVGVLLRLMMHILRYLINDTRLCRSFCMCNACMFGKYYIRSLRTHTDKFTHTYLPTYVPTYLLACMPSCIHTYIHKYINAFIHTYMHMHMYICIHTYTYMNKHGSPCVCVPIYPSIYRSI